MNFHKKEVQILKSEKDTLESVLSMKTQDVKKTLTNELMRIEEEMKRYNCCLRKDTSPTRRPRTRGYSSRSPLLRGRRLPCNSSCWACSVVSLSLNYKWGRSSNEHYYYNEFITVVRDRRSPSRKPILLRGLPGLH
jgi:hypothetical protein